MRGMQLTKNGSDILAKCLLGKELKFSRCALGSGDFDYSTEKVFDLTEIRNFEMTLPIESIEKVGDGTVRIIGHATNKEIYTGFAAREYAVFALDPDSNEELLYSYCNVGDEYSFIPNNKSPIVKDIKISFVTIIRDAENVTANLDLSFAYTSADDFESHVNSENPHPNFIQKLDGVISTSKIWATDNDSNLHQISINNLKQLLREETVQSETETEKVTRAKAELGLDANLLVIEDFSGESVTDNFKIKVTSSAENGNLIGVESIDGIKTGGIYTISDGVNLENVTIAGVRYNISGYHCKLENRLDNAYNWNCTFLYKTTTGGADKKVLTYGPVEFGGVSANIERTVELEFLKDDISGDGFLVDGYFTLA